MKNSQEMEKLFSIAENIIKKNCERIEEKKYDKNVCLKDGKKEEEGEKFCVGNLTRGRPSGTEWERERERVRRKRRKTFFVSNLCHIRRGRAHAAEAFVSQQCVERVAGSRSSDTFTS